MTKKITIFWRNLYYESSLQTLIQLQMTIYEYFSNLMRGKILHNVNVIKTTHGTRVVIKYEIFKYKG